MKKFIKTETKYNGNYMVDGDYEDVEIVQEEDETRKAIKLTLYQDRWRTPKNTVEYLEKVIGIIKEHFI